MENKSIARIKEIKKLLTKDNLLNFSPSDFRPVKNIKSIQEKKLFSFLKSHRDFALENKFKQKEQLRKLMFNIDDIKDLPQEILSLPNFVSFESCHILVHEKGKPVGQNYSAIHCENVETKLIGVQNFNQLFNLIKKSKNKIFTLSENLKDDLLVLGNFLAKEIDLKNYSVIYLISRNSFLPPNHEEQLNFQNLSLYINPLLIKILDKEKNDLKKEVLKKSLENFPEKITIKKQNQVLFTNKTDSLNELANSMVFPLENDHSTMELSNFSKEDISTELYHSQRVSLLGELLNTLQHELSNPLFGLNLTSSILENEATDPEIAQILNEISQNAFRSQTIIKNFSNLYNDQQEYKKVKLYSFIEEVMMLTKSETKEIYKKIQMVGFRNDEEAKNFEITTNPTCLSQIVFNLIINAAQAIKEQSDNVRNKSIIIQIETFDDYARLAIIDDGPGVKNEYLESIFQAFFTTKGSGTGLGLSICQNLARQLGTKIEFQNNYPLLGATFSINLPIN